MIFDASGRALPVAPRGGGAPARAAVVAPPPASSLPAVIDATEANFEASILRSPVAVVLHATAGWSEPCKRLGPRLEAVARAARGALVYARLDVDAQPNLATQLAVRTLPAVWGLVRGRAVDQLQGLPGDERLRQFLEALIAAAEEAGAMPAPGAGEGGDEGLGAAESVLAGASGDVAHGECVKARAALAPLLKTLAEVEAGFRARAAAAAPAPLPPPSAGAPPLGSAAAMEAAALAKRRAAAAAKASPVPREIQDLGARALGVMGAFFFVGRLSFLSAAPNSPPSKIPRTYLYPPKQCLQRWARPRRRAAARARAGPLPPPRWPFSTTPPRAVGS